MQQPQKTPFDDAEVPEGVELRDYDDYNGLRRSIFDSVQNAFSSSFPVSYGGVKIELDNVRYEGPEEFDLPTQKKALLNDRYLSRRLKGTLRMFDENTGEQLDEMDTSLMRVPWLTQRNTFIHGGNEYATIMQSRLLPGVYTRRQANGQLETQFNVRPGTGKGFRVGFEPDTAQYRLRISQANLHLYSLLHDIGISDDDLKERWGEDVWKINAGKYDSRVLDKAYERLVPARLRIEAATREQKAEAVKQAFDKAAVNRFVAERTLPIMLGSKQASEQRAIWAGRMAIKQAAEKALEGISFAPDFTPEECYAHLWEVSFDKRAAVEALPVLLQAKKHSDNKEYDRKAALMLMLMQAKPDEFIVDQEDDKYPGITHVPTNFRMHVPKTIIPDDVYRHIKVEKSAVVKQRPDGKWELRTKDGKRVLGTHDTAQEAYKQEYAIQKSQERETKKKEAGQRRKAIIIKGNPQYIEGNEDADKFYNELKTMLDNLGYAAEFDPGEPHTIPDESAALWVGHSRGKDRLRFAPETVKTLYVDPYQDWHRAEDGPLPEGEVPPAEHYIVTDRLKKELQKVAASADADFSPDLSPSDMRESYNSIYGHIGPRLASMEAWPKEWLDDTDPAGWLAWYEQYHAGRRGDTDEKQIRRWKSFKARHGSQLRKNPTPRRAFALRNWGIDPLKLIDDDQQRKELEQAMSDYKAQEEAKWLKKHASLDNDDLVVIADFLNKNHNAGIPAGALSSEQLEQQILDFIQGESTTMNPAVLQAGQDGLKSVQRAAGLTEYGLSKNLFNE